MKKFFVLLIIIILSIVFFIFSNNGSQLLKPYISTYIENQFEENITVEIQKLKIDIDKIKLTAILNNKTAIKAQAKISLLEKDIVNNIQIHLPKADIKELLDISHQPPYAKGKADLHIQTPTLKDWKREAKSEIKLYDTILNKKVLKKELKIDIPTNTKISGIINIEKNTDILTSNGKLKSNLVNLNFDLAKYNYKTHKLDTDYYLNISDLSKFKDIIKQKLYGALEVNGNIHKDKMIIITGRTRSLDGIVDFKLIDKHIKAEIFDISVQKLMRLFNYPQIFNAKLVGTINYNLKKEECIIDTKLNNTRLLPNQLTKLIKNIKGLDLTRDSYNQTKFIGNIDQNSIKFNLNAKSKNSTILLKDANLNRKTEK
ncbi:MAG TPA: hypothetical protein ENK79_01480, partial [Campylobacterales bacterium]|nr:hypothetical protein [Campylobacterales bacterium]